MSYDLACSWDAWRVRFGGYLPETLTAFVEDGEAVYVVAPDPGWWVFSAWDTHPGNSGTEFFVPDVGAWFRPCRDCGRMLDLDGPDTCDGCYEGSLWRAVPS
jgi:hypothetical protein